MANNSALAWYRARWEKTAVPRQAGFSDYCYVWDMKWVSRNCQGASLSGLASACSVQPALGILMPTCLFPTGWFQSCMSVANQHRALVTAANRRRALVTAANQNRALVTAANQHLGLWLLQPIRIGLLVTAANQHLGLWLLRPISIGLWLMWASVIGNWLFIFLCQILYISGHFHTSWAEVAEMEVVFFHFSWSP